MVKGTSQGNGKDSEKNRIETQREKKKVENTYLHLYISIYYINVSYIYVTFHQMACMYGLHFIYKHNTHLHIYNPTAKVQKIF